MIDNSTMEDLQIYYKYTAATDATTWPKSAVALMQWPESAKQQAHFKLPKVALVHDQPGISVGFIKLAFSAPVAPATSKVSDFMVSPSLPVSSTNSRSSFNGTTTSSSSSDAALSTTKGKDTCAGKSISSSRSGGLRTKINSVKTRCKFKKKSLFLVHGITSRVNYR